MDEMGPFLMMTKNGINGSRYEPYHLHRVGAAKNQWWYQCGGYVAEEELQNVRIES